MSFVVQCICGEGRGKRRKRKEEAKRMVQIVK